MVLVMAEINQNPFSWRLIQLSCQFEHQKYQKTALLKLEIQAQ